MQSTFTNSTLMTGSAATPTLTIGPAPERLTIQQEANALLTAIDRAHELLDRLSSSPATNQASAPEMTLSAAVQSARNRVQELNLRLESLLTYVGSI